MDSPPICSATNLPHKLPHKPPPIAMVQKQKSQPIILQTPQSQIQPASSPSIINHSQQLDDGDNSKKKIISPFAPEATIPLPFQLDELGLGTTIWKRNERERYRVRCVNEGYEQLRRQLPLAGDRRLSKVDTLRLAIDYICHLELLLCDSNHDLECVCFKHSLSPAGSHCSGDDFMS